MIAVEDECAPWNAGVWQAEFESGAVQVRRTDRAPHVTMDVQALSQAYFGAPTLDALRAAGRLAVQDEAGFQALRSLLAGPPTWMSDEF